MSLRILVWFVGHLVGILVIGLIVSRLPIPSHARILVAFVLGAFNGAAWTFWLLKKLR